MFQIPVLLFYVVSIWGNWDSEQLNKLQYHFRVAISGRGEIQTWISDLNSSSFEFTKKKRRNGEDRPDTDRDKWYPSQNHFVFPDN